MYRTPKQKANERRRGKALTVFARHNRAEPTAAEAALRSHMTVAETGGRWTFERTIGGRYILDFYCLAAKLAVEG